MKVFLLLSPDPIQPLPSISDPSVGAAVTFSGLVRDSEEHRPISSLFY